MSEFTAGFTARHNAAAEALHRTFAVAGTVFAPSDIKAHAESRQPRSFAPEATPRHFSPADRDCNPTSGWDPFSAASDYSDDAAPLQGFIDPIQAARDLGFAEGKASGLSEASITSSRDRELVEALKTQLATAGQVDRERMATQLRQTVMLLVSRLIGEVGVNGALLAKRIGVAIELLADSAESGLLRLNPEDLPLIEEQLPKSVFAAGDPSIARGAFVLESASTIVEDGPTLWLEQLSQAIERVALPKD